jgi:hypothetical protein
LQRRKSLQETVLCLARTFRTAPGAVSQRRGHPRWVLHRIPNASIAPLFDSRQWRRKNTEASDRFPTEVDLTHGRWGADFLRYAEASLARQKLAAPSNHFPLEHRIAGRKKYSGHQSVKPAHWSAQGQCWVNFPIPAQAGTMCIAASKDRWFSCYFPQLERKRG